MSDADEVRCTEPGATCDTAAGESHDFGESHATGESHAAGMPSSRGDLPATKKRSHYKRMFYVLLILIILAVATFVLIQLIVTRSVKGKLYSLEAVPPRDVALILGARVYSDGTLSPMLRARMDRGIELYKSGKVEKLLLSGDHGRKVNDEVNAMREYALAAGVPAEDIFLDHAGFSTYDSVVRAREIFAAPSVIICTQWYHSYRAVWLAERFGLDAIACPVEDLAIYDMPANNVRESLARVRAAWDALTRRSTALGGPQIPIMSADGRDSWDIGAE
jgi:SanA protein